MDAPERICVRPKGSKKSANYTRDDLCADPALLAEAVEVLRFYASESLWDYDGGLDSLTPMERDGGVKARAFIAKLENRHDR